ncbi:MAG: hypothetical protein U0836_22540 [Pirellulales bacterium]
MARVRRALLALTLLVFLPSWAQSATVHATARLRPALRRLAAAEPLRVYRFVLMGPLTPARPAAAVIVEVSDDRWTAREFGFVEVALPADFDPNRGASGGLARWNEAAEQFEALALEP